MSVEKATLHDGRVVRYISDQIGAGAMKQVYFTEDKSAVVCFYKNEAMDAQRDARLNAILQRYNPTIDPQSGAYWRNLFCWPTGIIVHPRPGIVVPRYPKNFYFQTGPKKGKEKEGKWFTGAKARNVLPQNELGDFRSYLQICTLIARAVRKLHMQGLAHSDLSNKNILIDPLSGSIVVIDIDSLVVPGLFPPEVLGTTVYIAPEVIATQHLDKNDPDRITPSTKTDLHALAVLIYEYLLQRHPLQGPKFFSESSEEDELLRMGKKALFIEHPDDHSNRPRDLGIGMSVLGPYLVELFKRAFVDGLHEPSQRPSAANWELGLMRTWEMLYPCANSNCTHKWFVLHDKADGRCPFCGTKIVEKKVPILQFRHHRSGGVTVDDGSLVVYNGLKLFSWHAKGNRFPNEYSDYEPKAECKHYREGWRVINKSFPSMLSPGNNPVPPPRGAVALEEGKPFRLASETDGRSVYVKFRRF